jgi:hypothetical protein
MRYNTYVIASFFSAFHPEIQLAHGLQAEVDRSVSPRTRTPKLTDTESQP